MAKDFNEILNEVRENAITAASAVQKQAAKFYDASKHMISAEAIKRTIGKKLIELGKLTYKAAVSGEDYSEKIAVIVTEITELKESLAAIDAHIADIKNQKICPECGSKVTKESVFCNICGSKFPEPVVEEEPAEDTAEETAEETVEAAGEKADEIVTAAKDAVEEVIDEAEEAKDEAEAE